MIEAGFTIEPKYDEHESSSVFFYRAFSFFSNNTISDFIKTCDLAIQLAGFKDKLVIVLPVLFLTDRS